MSSKEIYPIFFMLKSLTHYIKRIDGFDLERELRDIVLLCFGCLAIVSGTFFVLQTMHNAHEITMKYATIRIPLNPNYKPNYQIAVHKPSGNIIFSNALFTKNEISNSRLEGSLKSMKNPLVQSILERR